MTARRIAYQGEPGSAGLFDAVMEGLLDPPCPLGQVVDLGDGQVVADRAGQQVAVGVVAFGQVLEGAQFEQRLVGGPGARGASRGGDDLRRDER